MFKWSFWRIAWGLQKVDSFMVDKPITRQLWRRLVGRLYWRSAETLRLDSNITIWKA